MQTRKLYYEDPFQKGFASTVVSCEEVKGGYAVVLAETVFYPEGGGISITSSNGVMWYNGKIKYNNSSMDRNFKY